MMDHLLITNASYHLVQTVEILNDKKKIQRSLISNNNDFYIKTRDWFLPTAQWLMLMLVQRSGELVQASSDIWRARSVSWTPLVLALMEFKVFL